MKHLLQGQNIYIVLEKFNGRSVYGKRNNEEKEKNTHDN